MPLYVSDSNSVHHQESSTVHTEMGRGHWGFAEGLLASIAQLGSHWTDLHNISYFGVFGKYVEIIQDS